jgi:hypothetical protein
MKAKIHLEQQGRKPTLRFPYGNYEHYYGYRQRQQRSQTDGCCTLVNRQSIQAISVDSVDNVEATAAVNNLDRCQTVRVPAYEADVDERVLWMDREWLCDKDVLDIGCNRGWVTMSIGMYLHPYAICISSTDGGISQFVIRSCYFKIVAISQFAIIWLYNLLF